LVFSSVIIHDSPALRKSGDLNFRGKPSWSRFQKNAPSEKKFKIWFGNELRNIGILSAHSLVTFDFDDKNAFAVWEKNYPDIAKNTAIQKSNKGYHVLFKVKRRIVTILRTEFNILNSDLQKVGDVLGKGRYVVVWPSIHPEGHEYHWLKGQAPWECGIKEINDPKEVGIEIVRDLKRYFRFLYLLLRNPIGSTAMVKRKIASIFRTRTHENRDLYGR